MAPTTFPNSVSVNALSIVRLTLRTGNYFNYLFEFSSERAAGLYLA